MRSACGSEPKLLAESLLGATGLVFADDPVEQAALLLVRCSWANRLAELGGAKLGSVLNDAVFRLDGIELLVEALDEFAVSGLALEAFVLNQLERRGLAGLSFSNNHLVGLEVRGRRRISDTEVLAEGRVHGSWRSEIEAVCHLLVLYCLTARILGCDGLLVECIAPQAVSVGFGCARSESVWARHDGARRRLLGIGG